MLIFLAIWQVSTCIPPSTMHPSNLTSSLSWPDLVLLSTDSIIPLELSVVTNAKHHFLAASRTIMGDCW